METTITLGGRAYTVAVATMKRSREWREKFQHELLTIVGGAKAIGTVQLAADDGTVDFGRIVAAVQTLSPIAFGMFDRAAEMVFAYDGQLDNDRDWIEENATDEEMLTALWQVVQLAFPFGAIIERLPTGLKPNGTSASSRPLSGKRTLKR